MPVMMITMMTVICSGLNNLQVQRRPVMQKASLRTFQKPTLASHWSMRKIQQIWWTLCHSSYMLWSSVRLPIQSLVHSWRSSEAAHRPTIFSLQLTFHLIIPSKKLLGGCLKKTNIIIIGACVCVIGSSAIEQWWSYFSIVPCCCSVLWCPFLGNRNRASEMSKFSVHQGLQFEGPGLAWSHFRIVRYLHIYFKVVVL